MLVITRPFTVLFHELGYAIPIILMTREDATIYVGSYGDKRHSINLCLGSLNIWIRYNPFGWRGGLCETPVANMQAIRDDLIIS
jgi:hypothetical protein